MIGLSRIFNYLLFIVDGKIIFIYLEVKIQLTITKIENELLGLLVRVQQDYQMFDFNSVCSS